MQRPLVSALSEYNVRPARLTSTVFPSARPVLTVLADPVEPEALESAATAITAAATITTAPPIREFRRSFIGQAFHRAGRLHQRTFVLGRRLAPEWREMA